MNRRDLLKLLPAVSAAAVIPTTEERDLPSENWGKYRSYFYLWSGWIPVVNQEILAGHWTATRPEEPFGFKVYSSYPGAVDKYVSDQLFDLSIKKYQIPPTPDMPAEKLDGFKNEAFVRLIAYIDEHWKELTHG